MARREFRIAVCFASVVVCEVIDASVLERKTEGKGKIERENYYIKPLKPLKCCDPRHKSKRTQLSTNTQS